MNTVTIEFSKGGSRYEYLYNGTVEVGQQVEVWSEFRGDVAVTVVAFQEGKSEKAYQKARPLTWRTQ